MYNSDNRTVLTLDAGGTNMVFSAIRGCNRVAGPVSIKTDPGNLDKCLMGISEGFRLIKGMLEDEPVAISFAFPGPADYKNGVIGDLPNFPAFRGGVALGPYLEKQFGIPVFINNDGNLFAYGEALEGLLPWVNSRLEALGSNKRYNNLLGITFGTGFGAGVVTEGRLLMGDNSCGGDIWCTNGKLYPDLIAEEGVSIRAIKRVYREISGSEADLSPKEIFEIAEGRYPGNRDAAMESFRQFGETAGSTMAHASAILDGIIVIGGGIAGARDYFMPALLKEMNSTAGTFAGDRFHIMESHVYDLENEFEEFAKGDPRKVRIPSSNDFIEYDPARRIGVGFSKLGTSHAVSVGAYAFALNKIDCSIWTEGNS